MLMVDLIHKLRYMGRQYASGQEARGGGAQKHYLEEAADELERLRLDNARLRIAAKDAPDILADMISTSETSCPPMHYLLTHDGPYGFHMANLWVRQGGGLRLMNGLRAACVEMMEGTIRRAGRD